MLRILPWLLLSFIHCYGQQPAQTSTELQQVLYKNRKLRTILTDKRDWDIQILYTQINRDTQNKPSFRTFYYNFRPQHYFYPASTVKLPALVMALEKLNRLQNPQLSKNTPIRMVPSFPSYPPLEGDSSSASGYASLGHWGKQILLYSDNEAFNRLYDFLGQEYMNQTFTQKGYIHSRFSHRLSVPYTFDQNKKTPEVQFFDPQTKATLFTQESAESSRSYEHPTPILRGIGFYQGGRFIKQPFDFSRRNAFGLQDQHRFLQAILFPETVPESARFDLKEEDYRFIYQYMSQLPRETTYPTLDSSVYYDSYVKFLGFGDSKEPMPSHIRVFNKVGDAYGYLIDNAYIVDFENNIEFMLSAVIHCNSDGVFNDDQYDYDSVGFPFMGELGRTIYSHELKRSREHIPNLDRFKVTYDR
ncbi:MAG: serine hydrolase [Spirosomataceae bacterium]